MVEPRPPEPSGEGSRTGSERPSWVMSEMEVQQRLSNWPLLRLLWRDPTFRWAFLGCLIVGSLCILAILKIWVITPAGFAPQLRISALDFLEAAIHAKLAVKEESAGQLPSAQLHWKVAVQNNPAEPALIMGYLSNLVAQPARSPARSRTALEQSFWLLRLGATNPTHLPLILRTMEHFRFDELALMWATNSSSPISPENRAVALRAALRLGHGDVYAALRGASREPAPAAEHLDLFDAAWQLGWGKNGTNSTAARQRLEAAEGNAETAMTSFELQMLLAALGRKVDAYGHALQRLRDLHADTPAQHAAYWNLLRLSQRSAEAQKLALEFADPPVSSGEIVRVSTAFMALGLTNHASQFLEHFVPELGATGDAWTLLGDILLAQKRWSDLRELAIEIRRNPLASGSLAGFSHFLDGAAAQGEFAFTDAAESFARVPQNPIQDDNIAYGVAQALVFYEAWKPAEELLLSRTNRFHSSLDFWQLLVRVSYKIQDGETLLRAARRAQELAPDRADTLTDLAAALLVERTDPEETLRVTRRLVQANPQSVSARMNYALALLQNRQASAARAILLTFQPDRLSPVEREVWQFAKAQLLDLDEDAAGTLAILNELDVKHLFPKQFALVNELRARAEAKLGIHSTDAVPATAPTGQ